MATKSIASLLGQAMARVSVAESPDYAPMAKGYHQLTIKRSEFAPIANGSGYLVKLGMATSTNRWVWKNLCLIHKDDSVQITAARHFNTLLEQLGLDASKFTTPESFKTLEGNVITAYVGVDSTKGENYVANFMLPKNKPSKFQDDPMSGEIPF